MATRSTIAVEFADGHVEQVYCHYDGYLSNNGRLLLEHYNRTAAEQLVASGNMSALGETVEDTEFYGERAARWRSYEDYQYQGQREEYNYILRVDDVWEVEARGKTNRLVDVV